MKVVILLLRGPGLEGKRVNAILGEFVATLIVYRVAVLGKHDDCFIRPLELDRAVGVTVVVHANESALHMRWTSTGVSALASFLPKKSQG